MPMDMTFSELGTFGKNERDTLYLLQEYVLCCAHQQGVVKLLNKRYKNNNVIVLVHMINFLFKIQEHTMASKHLCT